MTLMHQVDAASAVAVGINPKSGRLSYSYWKGNATENEARSRALAQGTTMGYTRLKVIGSTSKLGYGAVVWFETANKTSDCAVAFGAASPQKAIDAALQKAKAAGGRYALVEAVWHDGSPNTRDLIKL